MSLIEGLVHRSAPLRVPEDGGRGRGLSVRSRCEALGAGVCLVMLMLMMKKSAYAKMEWEGCGVVMVGSNSRVGRPLIHVRRQG